MIFALLLKNWKIALIGVVLLLFVSVCGAYAWQRGNLIKSKADLADMTIQKEAQDALVVTLQKNLEDAKKHVKRVEVIKWKDRIVTEVITRIVPADSPIVTPIITATPEEKEVCKRYVQREEKTQKQMASVRDAAALITDFYNGVRTAEDYNKIRAEVLSKTDTAQPATP